MNALDLALLFALVYAAARGYRQGALSQVAAFGGAALGLIVGALFAPDLAASFVEGPGLRLALITLALFVVSILVFHGIGLAVGLRLRRTVEGLGAAFADRTAGVVVGLVGLAVTVWLVASALVQGPVPAIAQQVQESRIVGAIGENLPPAPDVVARLGTYLDRQGFPQVFSGLQGGTTAPPVAPPEQGVVAAASRAGAASTVQVEAPGCGAVSVGSGFVAQPGFVVTNAHVLAGADAVRVRSQAGTFDAEPVHLDADVDLAVLAVPGLPAPPIAFASTPADRDVAGATLGFPGGQPTLNVRPAAVRSRGEAVGRDIYGRGLVSREILTLDAGVQRGDSGGPFVTGAGEVAGVVFASSAAEPSVGYALTAAQVQPAVEAAVARNTSVPTGECRF